jgi:hypothetical protein
MVEEKIVMESKEESEKRPCYKYCPGLFEECHEMKCNKWYNFY